MEDDVIPDYILKAQKGRGIDPFAYSLERELLQVDNWITIDSRPPEGVSWTEFLYTCYRKAQEGYVVHTSFPQTRDRFGWRISSTLFDEMRRELDPYHLAQEIAGETDIRSLRLLGLPVLII